MISRLSRIVLLFLLSSALSGRVADAQASKPAVDEDIQKALRMDARAAEAAAQSPKAAVRYLTLKKLCESNYDDKKLIPLLMTALQDPNVPIKRLAVMELAKRKHGPATKPLFQIVLDDGTNWQLRLAAEWALEQIAEGFPADLNGALLKTEKKQQDGTRSPDPAELKKAIDLYQQEFKKRFPG